MMKCFSENSQEFLTIQYFRIKPSSKMLSMVLNTPAQWASSPVQCPQ